MKEANFSSRREYWLALLAEQKASGYQAAEFCRRKGISAEQFYSWVSRLKKERKQKPQLIRIEPKQVAEPFRITFQNGATLHFGVCPEPEWIKLLLELVS